jgi:hypothetical protein
MVRGSPFAICHSPFAIADPQFAIRHSPFAMRNSLRRVDRIDRVDHAKRSASSHVPARFAQRMIVAP